MKKLLVAAAVAGLVGTANAQSAFDGVNVQLGVGMGTNSVQQSGSRSYTSSDASFTSSSSNNNVQSSKANVFGNISLGYSQGFANNFNLAANVFYMMGSDDAGTSNYSYSNSNLESNSGNSKNTLKNMWGIVLEPGYYFGKESLGFLKLGWAQGKVGITSTDFDSTQDPATTSFSGSANTQGFLYGLGFKQMVSKNVYLGFEAYQIQFSSKSFSQTTVDSFGATQTGTLSLKPLNSYAGITLGYKF